MDRRQALLTIGAATALAGANGALVLAQVQTDVELLMFDDLGCPYCRRWHHEVGEAYRNSNEGRAAPLRVLQIREARPAGIALASPVRATPTFVLVQDRREVGRIVGYGGPDFFWSMLSEQMKKLRLSERKA